MSAARIAIGAAALVGGFLMPALALAHSWYDPACCSGRDCAPYAGKVIETAAGYTIESGEFIPRAEAKQGRDEDFHVCRHVTTGRLICFYIPMRGS